MNTVAFICCTVIVVAEILLDLISLAIEVRSHLRKGGPSGLAAAPMYANLTATFLLKIFGVFSTTQAVILGIVIVGLFALHLGMGWVLYFLLPK